MANNNKPEGIVSVLYNTPNVIRILITCFLFALANGLLMLSIPIVLQDAFAYTQHGLTPPDTCDTTFNSTDPRNDICDAANYDAQVCCGWATERVCEAMDG